MYASGGLAFVIMAILLLNGASFFLGLFSGLLIGAGLPHMVVNFLMGRRIKNFTTNFPDAIELLVRGLKSGMPVSETLSVIAKEIAGSVGEEFKLVVEKIKIGKSMEEALQDTADRLGTPEFQFFVITLAIQRETGGNLAETLANLADVLRKRAQMKLKIRAMSSESKASAYIVGSLPFFVFGMIWTINQEYLSGFFYEPRLMIAGVAGAVWMAIGVFIMAKMVNFEI
jgi:tight adherence protein B